MAKSGKNSGSLNPFDIPAIGVVMKTPVRWKKNKEKPFSVRDTITRAVNPKVPEVMVKIKRGGKSASHLMAHLEYITRNGKLDAETERGEIIQGKAHLKEVFKDWTSDRESIKKGARNAINAIFSMPPGTDPQGVKNAVREFAKQELSNYQYMFVLHTDEEHPHCHLSIRTLGIDGKKLDPRKEDLQVWREVFAQKLWDQKIPAKATYRESRGVVERPLSMAQYKAKHWEREQEAKENRPKTSNRDIVGQVFDDVMKRGITRYDEFLSLVSEFGIVQQRDSGKPTEYLNVRPLGAGKGVNLKDYVFSRQFIELPPEEKQKALSQRLYSNHTGLHHDKRIDSHIAQQRSLGRIRNNLRSASADIQAAQRVAGGVDQAARNIANRSVIRALAAVIRGRGRDQTEGREPAVSRKGIDDGKQIHDSILQRRSLERIKGNLDSASIDLEAAQRVAGGVNHAARNIADRAAINALAAVIQRHSRNQAEGRKLEDGIIARYSEKLKVNRLPKAPPRKRSERDIYTYVARVENAIRATAGEPIKWDSGKPMKKDPWGQQVQVREAWRKIAAALRASGAEADKSLARDIDAFVDDMPPIQTQHQRLTEQFTAMRQANIAKQKESSTATKKPVVQQPKTQVERAPETPDKGRER